jgi:hypothetical protein
VDGVNSKKEMSIEIPRLLNKYGLILRRLTAFALVSSFVWVNWFQQSPIGFSSETMNGVTHVVASSSPVVVSLSILGIFLFIFVMTREVHIETS